MHKPWLGFVCLLALTGCPRFDWSYADGGPDRDGGVAPDAGRRRDGGERRDGSVLVRDGGRRPDAASCGGDPNVLEGRPCTDEGATCGESCNDPCQWCNFLVCISGLWQHVEVFPDPTCRNDGGVQPDAQVCPTPDEVRLGTRCAQAGLECTGYCPSTAPTNPPNGLLSCVATPNGPLWQVAAGSCFTPPPDGGTPQTCTYTSGSANGDLPGVRLAFQGASCRYSLAQVISGIQIPYQVDVDATISNVVPLPDDAGGCGRPGPSGLIVFEELYGNGQRYCLCDTGLCMGPSLVPITLQPGRYESSFQWQGRNWSGPSDTNNPMGALFPPGQYTLKVSARGTHPSSSAPFSIWTTFPITITP